MAGKIFISYRRSETAWAARALFERLWREFPDRVFIDLEGIALGLEFDAAIEQHLEGCHAMLAVIGPTWLSELQRRAKDKKDYVRVELARALERRIPVVPVLIDSAEMPDEDDLPESLKAITVRNGLKVTPDTFDAQLGRVVGVLRTILQKAGVLLPASTPAAPAIITRPRESWISNEGHDNHGRWAEFSVNGIVQRLRWIEPGTFWMGSTDAERRRFGEGLEDKYKKWMENEAPRHRVRLTQGFWLADTACTQALWQTVVGDNPSQFTSDLQLPVEQVSWTDVMQKFLPALNRAVPGLQAVLPTEAQWEYACRAGTETPYWFGEQISTEQGNYNGNYPPPGGSKGLYRERTVPVKALPANGWGLYQMHGNVWEWCTDWLGAYPEGDVVDPKNSAEPQDQGCRRRVLRGGSWIDRGRLCRSAFRFALQPGDRAVNVGVGFRLARGLAD